jgi:hypothetical protein
MACCTQVALLPAQAPAVALLQEERSVLIWSSLDPLITAPVGEQARKCTEQHCALRLHMLVELPGSDVEAFFSCVGQCSVSTFMLTNQQRTALQKRHVPASTADRVGCLSC